jgi:Ca2+/Na+ antiporter
MKQKELIEIFIFFLLCVYFLIKIYLKNKDKDHSNESNFDTIFRMRAYLFLSLVIIICLIRFIVEIIKLF